MPLYEYRCRKCGKVVEKIQKMSDRPLNKCEACGGKLERLVSAPAIHFKGSGWYVTDYPRKSSPGESAKSESSSESKDTQVKDAKGKDAKAKEPAKAPESRDAKPAKEKS